MVAIVGIVTSFVHANYKENLMTRFSANKQNRFLKAMATAHTLKYQKPKFVSLTCLMPFLAIKEKTVNET